MQDAGAGPGIGLYVHWPFCLAKCPYCDFNSHVGPAVDHGRWARALAAELDHFAAEAGRRRLTSIFFGGGTPSLMAPATVAGLLERAALRFDVAPDVEITLEANPTSVEAARLAGFRAAGVNRVSLGVQALDDAALRFLGREHGANEALAALRLAKRLFPRVSFDLIYARPGQSEAAWRAELARALDHADGHLSLYQLTIEPGTRFATLVGRGELTPLDDDRQADLFELTQDVLEAAGLPAYEVSNHAAPGEACRHNLTYWRYGDYIGIGPGAHGRLTLSGSRLATETARMPRAWLEQVEAQGHAERERVVLDPEDQLVEMTIMGLRLVEGIEIARLERVLGRPFAELVPTAAVEELIEAGFLGLEGGRLAATAAGRTRLDAVLARLLSGTAAGE